ncbi:helix-turn-helix domain-containing protein [Halorarum halophilum]|uniref:Helix-turn-helix domain-containing protein n=1 Tax=Halorarum halophilum TaxID=2743090 RepID=A0A7D5L2T4_9EURY|nr:helix-turn-helix domain-containing protein [Halobaculum halophilum]QLG28003.1 helix-turn-helix domain-containing protein [Halobaculum halophilum]
MRYLTVLVRPSDAGAFHPLGAELTAEPSVRREAIHHVDLLADGSVLLLAEGSGDRERYEEIMRGSPHVLEYLVTGEDRWTAMSRLEPTDASRRALELGRESDVAIETPIRFEADGSLRITYLGSDERFGELVREVADGDDVSFEVVGTGEYEPGRGTLMGLLTGRQREVLEAAVDVGYYSTPREATHADVAAAVGIAPTTAGEHLRKAEERVFGALAR